MNIKKIHKNNYRNHFILMIPLTLIAYEQFFSQWENTNLPSTIKVTTLAICDSFIFAGTDGEGIFLSTDEGDNWISSNNGLQNKIVNTIFAYGTRIFAGTETGASVSTDKGANWKTINTGLANRGVWSFAAGVNEYDDTTLFAGAWSGIYASVDNGENWEPRGLPDTKAPVHSIVVNNSFIYAATLAGGLFSSDHNGYTWNNASIINEDIVTGIYSLVPVYSLTSIDTIVIAGAAEGYIYYSVYNASFFRRTYSFSVYNNPVLCFTVLNTIAFAAHSDGYLQKSINYGLEWEKFTPSFTHEAIYSLNINDYYIFAATESGVWRYPYPGRPTSLVVQYAVPTGYLLEQNYPNPFNPITTIEYSIPVEPFHTSEEGKGSTSQQYATLKIYDVLGNEITTLVNKRQPPGKYHVQFNGSDLPSGAYIYNLKVSGYVSTKKLMLLK